MKLAQPTGLERSHLRIALAVPLDGRANDLPGRWRLFQNLHGGFLSHVGTPTAIYNGKSY